MKKFTVITGLCLACLLFLTDTLNAQMVMSRFARTLTTSNGDVFYSYEYRPQGYNPSGTTLHPLIIFLHGIGEIGNNISDLPNLEIIGLPYTIKNGSPMTFNWNGNTESFVVMAPMSRETSTINPDLSRFHPLYIQATIDYAINNLKVDPNRVYLTGLSYGGGGTLNYISLNYSNTQQIAAAAPVSTPAHFNANGPTYVKNANLPVWAFVGALDGLTPPSISQNVVNGINALNPSVRARLSTISSGGHNTTTYNAVYNHPGHPNGVYEDPISLYEWFLGQNKSLSANVLPVANAGTDQTIAVSPGTATLNGTGSSDADGIVRYLWKQISGPATISITNTYTTSTAAAASHASKNISGLTTAGIYEFELTVVDARAGISKDIVQITAGTPPAGKAVTFTTIGGRIIAGNVTQFVNASALTVEAYVKYEPTNTDWSNAEASIARNLVTTTDRVRLFIDKTTKSVHFVVANGTDVKGYTASNVVTPDTWTHIAAVFDGTQTVNTNRLKIYINGVSQTLTFTGTIPATTSGSTAAVTFGGEPSASKLGAIDEVRVWNTALSAGTIASWKDKLLGNCHPNFSNLAVYYPLDNDANPAQAAAGLGTSYSSPIFYGNYIGSSQATTASGCGSRIAVAPSPDIKPQAEFIGKVFPNPTKAIVQLELNTPISKSVAVDVTDMFGRYLLRNRRPLTVGNNRISVNLATLPPGTYVIEVKDGKTIRIKYKVVKQ